MNRSRSEFARLYEEHVWHVFGFLAYRIGDRTVVEDLTQATFERALRAWSRFDPRRASERTWLFTIARNLLIDHHRRERPNTEELVPERVVASIPGPEERLTATPELDEALSALSDRDREVLALRFGADLSGPEIAGLLGLSVANVQQITSRSLRRLRETLDSGANPTTTKIS